VFFTIPHFDGFPAVLIQLRKVSAAALGEALTDGWLVCAPPALASQFLNRCGSRTGRAYLLSRNRPEL
jgi:hypothetical protein